MNQLDTTDIRMIPVSSIDILNPRARNQKEFKKFVENISAVGLKKPITVSPKPHSDPPRFYLVCGQGRMEAFMALGQEEIPAVVIHASEEECMVMSLVENLSRRKQRPLEQFHSVKVLKQRGYSNEVIGEKIGMSGKTVGGMLTLLEKGEEGLIRAVMQERIPITVASIIAGAEEKEAQEALQNAYESEGLRGRSLLKAKRIVEQRYRWGPYMRGQRKGKKDGKVTGKKLALAIQQEADRRRLLIRKADRMRNIILFVTSAIRKLRADPNFTNILRAVGLVDMPEMLDKRVNLMLKGEK